MRRALVYLWTAPTTLLGLWLWPLAYLTGGGARVVDGVLEFHGGLVRWMLRHLTLLPGGARAMTLGHVVLGISPEALDDTRTHERIHVRQAERWGPLFVPAYLLASLIQFLRGRNAYRDNPFEREAFDNS